MATQSVNGIRLFHEFVGEAGPPLALVHGSWGDHHGWDQVVPLLASSHRALIYDRRGHGQSERPSTQGSVAEDVADLAALIEALEIGPAHVIGGSLGATIALRLAIGRPELVQSVAAHEPPLLDIVRDDPVHGPLTREIKGRIVLVASHLTAGEIEAGTRLFVETVAFGPGAWEQIPREMRQGAMDHAPTFLDETRDPELFDIDLDALAKVGCPVLLTRSRQSPPWCAPVVARLAAAMPDAETHVFPDAAHDPMRSHPAAYAAVISRFVAASQLSIGAV